MKPTLKVFKFTNLEESLKIYPEYLYLETDEERLDYMKNLVIENVHLIFFLGAIDDENLVWPIFEKFTINEEIIDNKRAIYSISGILRTDENRIKFMKTIKNWNNGVLISKIPFPKMMKNICYFFDDDNFVIEIFEHFNFQNSIMSEDKKSFHIEKIKPENYQRIFRKRDCEEIFLKLLEEKN